MTQLQAIHHKFKQMVSATKELQEIAEAKGVCAHCVIHDIIDTDSIAELSPQDIETIKNLYMRAEIKRTDLINMLKRFDPSLVK